MTTLAWALPAVGVPTENPTGPAKWIASRHFSGQNDGDMSSMIFPRILVPPEGSFFLFGPRGVGKSAWLRGVFPEARRIDLLDEALYQSYLADVGAFAGELRLPSPRLRGEAPGPRAPAPEAVLG